MEPSLEDFLTRLNQTRSANETWDETVSFMQSLGFERIMYGYSGPHHAGEDLDVRTLSNYGDSYQERYLRERYYLHDPVVQHCVSSLTPRLIGVNALPYWPDRGLNLNAIQYRITREAAECGMKVGLAFPLRSAGPNPLAGISLSNAMPFVEFEKFIAERKVTAHLAAVYAHTHIQMQFSSDAAAGISLSPRELECLLWTAQGLSSKAVARRLNVSFKTVEFHIGNAMSKLQAKTRSHAVARAIAFGFLQP